ncbi:hypothetical protein KUCAC02_032643, partial [Chaenocephalus aceratus]
RIENTGATAPSKNQENGAIVAAAATSLHESITLPWERDRDSVDSQLHLTSRPANGLHAGRHAGRHGADTRAATGADTRADTRAATLQCVSGSFQLARSFLCIPATSTPSERIFSGGHICSQKSLSRDHVERGDVNEAQLGEDEASERKACWQSRRPLEHKCCYLLALLFCCCICADSSETHVVPRVSKSNLFYPFRSVKSGRSELLSLPSYSQAKMSATSFQLAEDKKPNRSSHLYSTQA